MSQRDLYTSCNDINHINFCSVAPCAKPGVQFANWKLTFFFTIQTWLAFLENKHLRFEKVKVDTIKLNIPYRTLQSFFSRLLTFLEADKNAHSIIQTLNVSQQCVYQYTVYLAYANAITCSEYIYFQQKLEYFISWHLTWANCFILPGYSTKHHSEGDVRLREGKSTKKQQIYTICKSQNVE